MTRAVLSILDEYMSEDNQSTEPVLVVVCERCGGDIICRACEDNERCLNRTMATMVDVCMIMCMIIIVYYLLSS